MAATPQTEAPPAAASNAEMQELARRHLWMHFTRMGSFDSEHEVPIIVKGEGCYVWDYQRQPLPRRPLGAVLRQRRPRPHRDRRRDGRAGLASSTS